MARFALPLAAATLASVLCAPTRAAIDGYLLGTSAPPDTLGGVDVVPFALDSTPVFAMTQSVATPIGGSIDFSIQTLHMLTPPPVPGLGWLTWGHGYAGDVYVTSENEHELIINLPRGTQAFYLYIDPNPYGGFFDFTVTATGTAGSISTLLESIKAFQFVEEPGLGAKGFGFVASGPDALASITVSSTVNFAVGEFGIAGVPAPGSLALLGLAGLARPRRRG